MYKDKIYIFAKKFVPLWIEIVESGLLVTLLISFNVKQEYLAIIVILKSLIKGYYLKNTRFKPIQPTEKKGIEMAETMQRDMHIFRESTIKEPLVTTIEAFSPNVPKITLEDRVDAIVKHISQDAKTKIGREVYEEDSLRKYILTLLLKSEEEIAKEAIGKLTNLQKKALGIGRVF